MSSSLARGASGGLPLSPTHPKFSPDAVEDKTLAPYPEQAPFLAAPEGFNSPVESDARFHAFISGLGAGKTLGGIIRVLLNVQEWNPGEVGMIVSPTVPSLRNVIIPELRKWNVLANCEYRSSKNTLVFPNGARVILESADNDRKIERLRGPSIAWFWLDEAALMPEKVWDIMVGRLRAGQYRNAFISTTPKGKANWVYPKFGPGSDANTVLGVSSTENPYLPEDYLDSLASEYSGSFYSQEVEGQFVKFEGLVYPWFDRDDHTIPFEEIPGPEFLDHVWYGIDWGFKNPFSVIALGSHRHSDRVYVLEEFRDTRVTINDIAEIARDMQNRWRPGTFWCDPAEPSNIEELSREGLDARKANNSVDTGIRKVTSFEDRLLVNSSAQGLIDEFSQYQYDDDSDKDEPIKKNDHSLDALRYGLLSGTPGKQTIPSTW